MTAQSRFKYLIASVIFFFFFLILSFLIQNQSLTEFDTYSIIGIQSFIPKQADAFLSLFSILGTFELCLVYLSIIFMLIFFKEKKIFLGVLTFFAIAFIELGGKILLFHPGPPFEYFRNPFVLRFPSGFIHTNYSYPSGHMGRTAFFTVLIAILVGRWLKKKNQRYVAWILLGVIFIIVCISRVSLGEHWLSDVLGGVALGTSLGLLSFVFW